MRTAASTLLTCAVLVAVAGCGSSSSSSSSTTASVSSTTSAAPVASGPVRSGVVQIAYRNIAISPASVTVKVGSTVRWTNFDGIDHNVMTQGTGPLSFASANFATGSYEQRMTKVGVIHYLCTIHPAAMQGTITVVP